MRVRIKQKKRMNNEVKRFQNGDMSDGFQNSYIISIYFEKVYEGDIFHFTSILNTMSKNRRFYHKI